MSKKRIDRKVNVESGAVTFTVLDTGKVLAANISDFPDAIVRRLVLHGINAKVGDSAANPDVDAYEALSSTLEQLKAGTWNVKGAGGASRVTILAEAIARVKNKSTEEVMETFDAQEEALSEEGFKAWKAKLAKNPKVAAVMLDIKNERLAEQRKSAKAAAKDAEDDLEGF